MLLDRDGKSAGERKPCGSWVCVCGGGDFRCALIGDLGTKNVDAG